MTRSHSGRERVDVERDGEQITVFNHCNVTRRIYVNALGGQEEFESKITEGESSVRAEYITADLAARLEQDVGANIPDDVEVVDLSDEEVTVL